jgi:hypothetical protein
VSYTNIEPKQLKFFIAVSGDDLWLTFVCPRCSQPVLQGIDLEDLVYGFEVECHNVACRAPGERYGYRMFYDPRVTGSMLGLSDRPLHEDNDEKRRKEREDRV